MIRVSPAQLEIFKNKLSSIAEEMGESLKRSAFSPNIRERRDFSCAVFDRSGRLVAQAAHIPVHLGSMSFAVKGVIEELELYDGDVAAVNDPFRGGTHLPDLTLVTPVFYDGKLRFYVACRAHHSDIGGLSAGSMSITDSIFSEGLIIPPLKVADAEGFNPEILKLIVSNTRKPQERIADLKAQLSAVRLGARRLKVLFGQLGEKKIMAYSEELLTYSERLMRALIGRIPDGVYEFEDYLDNDGFSENPLKIKLSLKVRGKEAELDFSGTSKQSRGGVNCPKSVTVSAVLYAFLALSKGSIPANDGAVRPIRIKTKKGSLIDATFPSAVSAGNVETSQRIVDVVLGALSKALPGEIPAASQGTMNNVSFGNSRFTYYETIGGGMGAWNGSDGESAVHSHMTNTLNTPVEALEFEYPVVVREYSIREGSGGKGRFYGGDGICREFEFLDDVELSVISERRIFSPYGLFGGSDGKRGKNLLFKNGTWKAMPPKFRAKVRRGDRFRIETPGGGGWGKPQSEESL